ncbi:DNA translocase FtsK 4TM domain-containing protein [Psychromarinibacter sp. C21-152]|uniref:DNA translocase FtsK n=1 Tax=Psychromarinibacter sediminicola TaxID=3033385 RepID=A0AAE3T7U1_9RHOB|nr:DNA translocase FtsK [Psychromarinibacter sediminicola]MDF0600680.1 DNA translocase FtsK 4TM domain-containing protein [Psychromarinibacter sediminicola]
MASYQVRQRERLFDSKTQAVLERRSKELLGVTLVVLGVLTGMILFSYVPDDPSWMSATDEPARNLLGRFGASIASPLFIIVGFGAWGFPLVFFGWGVRFLLHKGSDQALSRVIFAPIAIALASVYASTHVPSSVWTHAFGLGGLFGDTVLGAVLGVVPITATFGLKVLALVFALGTVGMALFVLGFTVAELRGLAKFMGVGFVLAYASLLSLLGRGATGAVTGAMRGTAALKAARAERAERRRLAAEQAAAEEQAMAAEMEVAPRMTRAARPLVARRPAEAFVEEAPHPEPAPEASQKAGLRLRLPGLMKRETEDLPEPELVETDDTPELEPFDAENGDRIKAKISSAVKARVRQVSGRHTSQPEPSLTRGRGHGPKPMLLNNPAAAEGGMPAEPPLTAHQAHLQEPPVTTPVRPSAPQPAEDTEDESWAAYHATQAEPEMQSERVDRSAIPAPHRPPEPEPRAVVQHAPRKPTAPSRQAQAEAQPQLQFEEPAEAFEHPPLSLLTNPAEITRHHLSDEALEQNARMLETVLDDYGVKGEIVAVRPGPVVTMYELEPAPGLKASRVIGLADDIARSMSALSARVSTVPGRSVIGIELPNANREKVLLREILSARDFGDTNQKLPLALGKDIGGDSVVANLAKMPHLLIAGTTGSGKSVAINTMILSLLYRLTPEECRLIMIDPKMLELSVYDGIPHLLSPVVTDPKKAVVALKWVVAEMEERYRKMSKMGVRNIEGYNGRVDDALSRGEMFSRTVQTGFDDDTGEPVFETEEFQPEKLPYIVVIVDEMADLMMVAGKEIEACIQRLAQMARASGIHLIMATQRPSVDVITGTIKANFPTRISFQVTSKVDSRTILGEQGAEQLLGMGDMLYMAGGARITRVHGPFVSDEEVEEIVNYLKAYGPPDYVGGVVDGPDEEKESDIDLVLGLGGNTDGEDALYDQAVAIVIKDRKCSTSYIQRKLAIGYNKAARLVEQMEEEGLVSASNHVGKREILVPEQQ